MQLDLRQVDRHTAGGAAYKVYQARFETTVPGKIFDALPAASRTAHLQLLEPEAGEPHACIVHLAATGDHGFARRRALAAPLTQHGIASLILESPYYGLRRPDWQRGSKLRTVSDLLVLGWATIYEALHLLHHLQTVRGYRHVGISGLSMGGVHACMTAGLHPGPLACTPLLAPRSAAVAYCDGAMQAVVHWPPLLAELDEKRNHVRRTVSSAAHAVSVIRAARHALALLEQAPESLQQQQQQPHQPDTGSGGSRPLAEAQLTQQQQLAQCSAPAPVPETAAEAAATSAMASALSRLTKEDQPGVIRKLKSVLETYTDVTRFPVPQRPDAAVLVAAADDAYVSTESVELVHKYWEGSEMRVVPGGHVSAFLMHQPAFRRAMLDSVSRLQQPAATGQQQAAAA